jgi:signal transduction histidine kinase
VLGVSRDITARKQAEIALVEARDKLEEKVKERTAELQASQSQLHQLTKQIIGAQEDERRRVSRELHDTAGQLLITLKYGLVAALSELPEDDRPIHGQMKGALVIVDQVIQQVRDLAHSLRPPALEVGGLNLSLKDLCRDIAYRIHMDIDYKGEELGFLPDETSITLYRFVQESLTNVIKHANATVVKVILKRRGKQISLTVRDNGKGMVDTKSREGIGLAGIEERLKLLNGELIIKSRPGRGTQMTACVPFEK